MSRDWRFAPHDSGRVQQLSAEMRISPLLAQVLLSRGYETADAANEFLTARMMDLHSPDGLPGANDAADRIVAALNAGRRITIYGDYDVDGVTGTSLLWECIRLAGGKADYYIPHRLSEGYGLNCQALRQLHEDDPTRLVVTVDCGVASVEEADLCRQLGLELIVTDHHQFGERLPDAASVVHPRRPDGRYPFGDLCGAGVAFKLAWAVCQRLGDGKKASPSMREFLKSAVGLAAIGTIADVVPLVGENRILVRYGLTTLLEHPSLGLRALLRVAKLEASRTLGADDIAFGIAPRINAAGRLGQARLAVELLTTDNEERAKALADYLDELNKNRRSVERKIFQQAKQLVQKNEEWLDAPVLVLADEDWHVGVVGIVANRISDHFEKPTILIALNNSDGVGQGSGRTFGNFDLFSALSACADTMRTFGGHRAAAGLTIEREQIDVLRSRLCEVAADAQPLDDDIFHRVDAEVLFRDVTRRAILELERLGPFGEANPRPIFVASDVELAAPPRKMGDGDRHLSLLLRQHGPSLRAVAFGRGDWADEMEEHDGPFSICFAPSLNRYRGQESVQLQLIDWQPAAALSVSSDEKEQA